MLILNPMYDVVFKFLMEDLDIAKGLIGAIIGENIESIQFAAQESPTQAPNYIGVTLMRLDFVAVIRLADGGSRKVFIELQKARLDDDALRFRHYLGKQYQRLDEVREADGTVTKRGLPLIAIYIVGFDIGDGLPACVKVDRVYLNRITGEPVKGPNRFIEALSHDTHVIQARKLHQDTRDELEHVLSVFGQEEFVDEQGHTKRFVAQRKKNALLNRILRRLHQLTETSEVREQMESEDVLYNEFEMGWLSREKVWKQDLQEARQRNEALLDAAVSALVAQGMSEQDARKLLAAK